MSHQSRSLLRFCRKSVWLFYFRGYGQMQKV